MLRRFRSEKERWVRVDTSGKFSKRDSRVDLIRRAPKDSRHSQ